MVKLVSIGLGMDYPSVGQIYTYMFWLSGFPAGSRNTVLWVCTYVYYIYSDAFNKEVLVCLPLLLVCLSRGTARWRSGDLLTCGACPVLLLEF